MTFIFLKKKTAILEAYGSELHYNDSSANCIHLLFNKPFRFLCALWRFKSPADASQVLLRFEQSPHKPNN